MNNSSAKKILVTLYGLGFLGLIIGTFYDLQINDLLYARGSLFPNFFKLTGEIPMTILMIACSLNILAYNKSPIKYLALVPLLAFGISSGFTVLKYFDIVNLPISIGLSITYYILGYLVFVYMRRFEKSSLLKFSYFAILAVVITLASKSLMKSIWGRERYFSLLTKGSFANFTQWYLPQGYSPGDEFRSFPSGHSASGATMLTLLFLPNSERKNQLIRVFAISWPLLVMASRIFDGGHYISDVCGGLIVALTGILIARAIINKIYNRKENNVRVN